MKKRKNSITHSIRQKIFFLVLFTLILVIAAYSVVILYQMNGLNKLVSETNDRQKESITQISRETMDSVISRTMGQRTQLEAMIGDDLFEDLAGTVRMLAYYADRLYDDPASFGARPYALPDPEKDGEISVQLLTEDGVDIHDRDIAAQLRLVANMSEMLSALYDTAGVNSCYIALPDGVMLLADENMPCSGIKSTTAVKS